MITIQHNTAIAIGVLIFIFFILAIVAMGKIIWGFSFDVGFERGFYSAMDDYTSYIPTVGENICVKLDDDKFREFLQDFHRGKYEGVWEIKRNEENGEWIITEQGPIDLKGEILKERFVNLGSISGNLEVNKNDSI